VVVRRRIFVMSSKIILAQSLSIFCAGVAELFFTQKRIKHRRRLTSDILYY